jgi:hypothetical protein
MPSGRYEGGKREGEGIHINMKSIKGRNFFCKWA